VPPRRIASIAPLERRSHLADVFQVGRRGALHVAEHADRLQQRVGDLAELMAELFV
jgi:hypothetical protein